MNCNHGNLGVEKDFKQTKKLYQLVASQGHPIAKYKLDSFKVEKDSKVAPFNLQAERPSKTPEVVNQPQQKESKVL